MTWEERKIVEMDPETALEFLSETIRVLKDENNYLRCEIHQSRNVTPIKVSVWMLTGFGIGVLLMSLILLVQSW